MDTRTLRILEFDQIRQALAGETTFAAGRELAERLEPTDNPIWIHEGQSETAEAVHLLSHGEVPPLGGLRDIRPYIERARLGSTLLPEELLDIAYTVAAARRLAGFVRQKCDEHGVLYSLADGIASHHELEEEIRRCIGEDGEVRDQASPHLARLRGQVRTLQGRIRSRLDGILREAESRRYLQEALVTVRGGRYVLPVKQEYRTGVPGIVHDQSASGSTLFIEPLPIVEMGNELRRLQAEEEAEIERILLQLTGAVQETSATLAQTLHAAARLDFCFAKGRLALRWDCVRPKISDERWINIKRGRHPLLPRDTVVPIDIWLGRDTPALVITGPNTGGKTVTLKTVGLFVLMAQAGLHVPADEGTELPLCDGVYADIGDEQGIAQSLSTFSSHMSNIVQILGKSGPRSLVLLDELGAGTDPTEGAALAMAILEHLVDIKCLTLATTHYSELKSFAYTEPGVVNASVEFDVETLRPTYRLSIGVAGSSNAFAISERLGLPKSILDRARQRLTVEEQKVEDLIRSVAFDRRRAEQARREAETLLASVEAERRQLAEERARLSARKDEIIASARQEAQDLLRTARLEVEALIGELRRQGVVEAVQQARAARLILVEREQAIEQLADEEKVKERERKSVRPEDVQPGSVVLIRSLGREGEVLTLPDQNGQVNVALGTLKMTVSLADLELSSRRASSRTAERGQTGSMGAALRTKTMQISNELDLRGLTTEEALEKVEKYLDEVILSNLPSARLIHGKGTGALRTAVQEYLKTHPQIKSFRLGEVHEGGSGVTVVEF